MRASSHLLPRIPGSLSREENGGAPGSLRTPGRIFEDPTQRRVAVSPRRAGCARANAGGVDRIKDVIQTVEVLVLDLLEWLSRKDRTYEETMDAWRTSCPKLPVWEDATDRGLLQVES